MATITETEVNFNVINLIIMKKGQIVDIYQKPLTDEDFEEKAKLLKKESDSGVTGFEYWKVQFLSDETKVLRLVKIQ